MMTGVPALGRIGQQDHVAGGASIDQLLLDNSTTLGGPTQTTKTPFGSLQLAADMRSDRDEVAPRVLSYRPSLSGQTMIANARQPMAPETQPLNVFNRVFGGSLPTGTNPATLLAQKLSVLTYMRGDLARMQTLIPASQKDRLAVTADSINQLEASIRQTYGMTTNTNVCTKPTMPANFAATLTRDDRGRSGTVYTKLSGRGLLRPEHARQPPAPGSRPHPAPPDQDRVRVRPRSGGDVHVVGRHELGRVPRDVPGRHDRGQPAVDAAPPSEPQRPQRRPHDARLAEPDQPLLLAGDGDGPAGVRHDSRTSTATC